MDEKCPPSSAAKYNRQFPKHTSRADSTSSYVVLRGGEATTPKQGINLLNSEVKAAKQQKTVKKQEERRRKSRRRSVGRDQNGNQVERRALKCSSRLCIHRLLQFLVLLFSVAALAIVILMVFGILWPGRCPCNGTGELFVFPCIKLLRSEALTFRGHINYLDDFAMCAPYFVEGLRKIAINGSNHYRLHELVGEGPPPPPSPWGSIPIYVGRFIFERWSRPTNLV